MKSSKSCECSGKSKCIVITIETCCKKSSDDKKRPGPKVRGDNSGHLPAKTVASGPVVSDRSASYIEDQVEADDNSIGMGDTKKESKATFANIQHRMFKLPLVTARHHGTGCAMEISVLERHEDSCMYKKEDTEGRNLDDDRCGSYDCIGRMVFRTCNTTETESDSTPSKTAFHGGSAGEKAVVDVLPPREEEDTVKIPSKSQSVTNTNPPTMTTNPRSKSSTNPSIMSTNPKSKSSTNPSTMTTHPTSEFSLLNPSTMSTTNPKSSQSIGPQRSKSGSKSAKSVKGSKSKSQRFESNEEFMSAERVAPQESMPPVRSAKSQTNSKKIEAVEDKIRKPHSVPFQEAIPPDRSARRKNNEHKNSEPAEEVVRLYSVVAQQTISPDRIGRGRSQNKHNSFEAVEEILRLYSVVAQQTMPLEKFVTSQDEHTNFEVEEEIVRFPSEPPQEAMPPEKSVGCDNNHCENECKKCEVNEALVSARRAGLLQILSPPKKEGGNTQNTARKHYPGDGCKLHRPKNPFSRCPVCADIALQTDAPKVDQPSPVISVEEEIISLSDFNKTGDKRKSNFLGGIFKRNNATDTKRGHF